MHLGWHWIVPIDVETVQVYQIERMVSWQAVEERHAVSAYHLRARRDLRPSIGYVLRVDVNRHDACAGDAGEVVEQHSGAPVVTVTQIPVVWSHAASLQNARRHARRERVQCSEDNPKTCRAVPYGVAPVRGQELGAVLGIKRWHERGAPPAKASRMMRA